MSEKRYIFMGGTQRSGTSLTRAILGSHSRVAVYPRDLPLWSFNEKYSGEIIERKDWEKVLSDVLSHEKAIYIQENFMNVALDYFTTRTFKMPDFIKLFIDSYAEKLNKEIPALKTPNNECYIEEIFEHFPNSKFVHLVRDPRNVEASRLRRTKIWEDEPLYHLGVWRESVRLAEINQKKYKDRYMVIQYEHLIQNQELVVRQMCDFLDLEFENHILEFDGLEDWSGGNSSFGSFSGGEINLDTLSRYTTFLPNSRRFLIQWKLGDLIKRMGYPKDDLQINPFLASFWKVCFTLDPRNIKSWIR